MIEFETNIYPCSGANGADSGASCTSQEDLTVNAEHSYSLGGSTSTNSTFGSDGDSMPESPLSLDDGNLCDFHFFLRSYFPLDVRFSIFFKMRSNVFEVGFEQEFFCLLL